MLCCQYMFRYYIFLDVSICCFTRKLVRHSLKSFEWDWKKQECYKKRKTRRRGSGESTIGGGSGRRGPKEEKKGENRQKQNFQEVVSVLYPNHLTPSSYQAWKVRIESLVIRYVAFTSINTRQRCLYGVECVYQKCFGKIHVGHWPRNALDIS